jgi:hypothetical protein
VTRGGCPRHRRRVVEGQFYLLIIGIVVFLGTFILLGIQLRHRRRRPAR